MFSLSVDLGHVLFEPGLHHPEQPRNGPARQQRREKHAATRKIDAGNATSTANKASDEKNTKKVEDITTKKIETAVEAPIEDEVMKANC